jgi:hypothetical protein
MKDYSPHPCHREEAILSVPHRALFSPSRTAHYVQHRAPSLSFPLSTQMLDFDVLDTMFQVSDTLLGSKKPA